MHVYKISCYSDNGSYYVSLNFSVTVIAENKEDAMGMAKTWREDSNAAPIPPDSKWGIEDLGPADAIGVIDYTLWE